MSEHVDMEWSEAALFLLECDKRRDPWEQAMSCLCEGLRRGTLPHGRGGRQEEGELENTSVPLGLQLRLFCEGMFILGDTHCTTVGEELEGHPLETNTHWETSSSELESSEEGEESVDKGL